MRVGFTNQHHILSQFEDRNQGSPQPKSFGPLNPGNAELLQY